MYIPKAFEETDIEKLHQLIRDHNFGVLFSQTSDGPIATHLPFMIDPEQGQYGALIGHFAKGNYHWQALNSESEILVVFQGPHSYISPSWYKHQVTVPTWNYAVVHAYGKIKLTQDKDALRKMTHDLTEFHESSIEDRWDPTIAEPIMDAELSGIVGFEIEITKLEGKYKFNQNRASSDQQGVVNALKDAGDPTLRAVAEIMRENLEKEER